MHTYLQKFGVQGDNVTCALLESMISVTETRDKVSADTTSVTEARDKVSENLVEYAREKVYNMCV